MTKSGAAASVKAGWTEPRGHCQNGRGDICLAGNASPIGLCCPEDSCDIDDGVRADPRTGVVRE
jgi:hypothetical protein